MSIADPPVTITVPIDSLVGMGNPVLSVSEPSEYSESRSGRRAETIRLSDLADTTRSRFGDGEYYASVVDTTNHKAVEQALAKAVLICFSPAASRGIIVTPVTVPA